MTMVMQKKTAIAPIKQPKFNLKKRYKKLNSAQKQLLLKSYATTFGRKERTLYYLMERDSLTDQELHFFAGIFDCQIKDLYTIPLAYVPSIFEMERKAGNNNLGRQALLDV